VSRVILFVFAGRQANMELQLPFIGRILAEHPETDVNALRCGDRYQPLQSVLMVKQCVAARQRRAVRLRLGQAQGVFDGLGQVDAQPPACDDAFVAQSAHCAECAGAGGFQLRQPRIAMKILCGVVHKDEVQSVNPKAIEAALDRFQCTGFRVVRDDTVGQSELKHLGVALVGIDLVQYEPAHLGANT
jgi:hypothetical protein